jgi:ArsR family metal-binding transcriptional regulator
MKTTIYISEKNARSAAKYDYASILNCKPSSIRLSVYHGNYAPNSTKCTCGETACYEFVPKMSKKQSQIWAEYQEKNGMNRFFWYGVCSNCGEKF